MYNSAFEEPAARVLFESHPKTLTLVEMRQLAEHAKGGFADETVSCSFGPAPWGSESQLGRSPLFS